MSFFEQLQARMENGLPITCASCTFLDAVAWRCNRKDTCGGPMNGRDFPDYEGPLLRTRFHERCLCCGGDPTYSMIVPGTTTRFGLCDAHQPLFVMMKTVTGALTDRIIPQPVILAVPR